MFIPLQANIVDFDGLIYRFISIVPLENIVLKSCKVRVKRVTIEVHKWGITIIYHLAHSVLDCLWKII